MRRVLPIYLVVNASRSMASRLVEVQHVLTALSDVLLYSPLLGDRVRVCVVSFAETARCVLPLSDLTEISEMPKLVPGRETRFAAAFHLLTNLTDTDAAAHLAAGISLYRPLVLLVTDGVPADPGWQDAINRFYRHAHPRTFLITLGVGESQAQEILAAMRVSGMRMLSDAPDQPLAKQIVSSVMSFADELVTSRMVVRPEARPVPADRIDLPEEPI